MSRKGKASNAAKKVQVGDHIFDSGEEARYYIMLATNPDVVAIEVSPVYQLVPRYKVRCARCRGTGSNRTSEKTGNPLKCPLCKGTGTREKDGVTYTADFRVTYKDGYAESVDVKPSGGFFNNERFPMKKRMFEAMTGETLIIAREKKPMGSGNFTREDK